MVGDMLCLGGSLLFAIVTVVQEIIIKKHSCVEYIAMVGFFGSIVAGFQIFMLELEDIYKFHWFNLEMLMQFSSFTVVQLLFQMLMAIMLKDAGAVALHLSFISADYYTLIAGILLFQFKVCMRISLIFFIKQLNMSFLSVSWIIFLIILFGYGWNNIV